MEAPLPPQPVEEQRDEQEARNDDTDGASDREVLCECVAVASLDNMSAMAIYRSCWWASISVWVGVLSTALPVWQRPGLCLLVSI